MAMKSKSDKGCCCLSLSKGCFLLGLLDLATHLYLIVQFSISVHSTPITRNIASLVMVIIGICTCSLMIYGSMMKNRWLLLPHIVWEFFIIGLFAFGGLAQIILLFLNGFALTALVLVIIMCCVLPLCILYWNVILRRYSEIKNRQSTPPPDLIEMA